MLRQWIFSSTLTSVYCHGCLYTKINLNSNLLTQNFLPKDGLYEILGKRMVKGWQLRLNRISSDGSKGDLLQRENAGAISES